MGKLLGSILAIATSPLTLIDRDLGNAVRSIGLTVIGYAVGGPLGAAIGSGLANAIAGFTAPTPKPDTTETSTKISRPVRVSAYGRLRLYGTSIVYDTASNGTAVDIYAIHDGKLDGIEHRYLNDDKVTLSGEFVTGSGSTSGGLFQPNTDGRYGGNKVSFYETVGSTPGTGGTSFAVATSLLGSSVWSSDHRGDGVVMVALFCAPVKSEDFQDIYPQATPPAPSLVARWQACPDPAAEDPLDESGWTWTENPVRHLLHYMLVREGPRPALPRSDAGYAAALAALRLEWWNRKIAPALDYWIDAAAVCDEARALNAGGTEAKYRACIAHKHTDTPEQVKASILMTFDGWMSPNADGAYVIYAGKSYTPTVSIGSEEIVSYSWEGGQPDDDDATNELVCSYVSSLHDYNTVQCDPWRDEADITQRGRILSANFEPGVPSHAQVRYLAKRKMARANATNRGAVTTNIAGRAVRGQRYINLRIEEAGAVFFDGIAEITGLSRSLSGGVTFQWVEFDPNVDAWTPATEEGEPASVGSRIAPPALETPEITGIAFSYDGSSGYIELDIDGPVRDDLTWFAHWRVAGASVWGPDLSYPDTDPGSPVAMRVGPVTLDTEIDIEVAYQVGDGRISNWSPLESISTSTTSSPPSDPADFSAADGTGSATVTWRNPVSINFGYVKLYRATSSDFGTASQVGSDISGGLGAIVTITDTLTAGTYHYWIRAYSTGGTPGDLIGPDSAVVS